MRGMVVRGEKWKNREAEHEEENDEADSCSFPDGFPSPRDFVPHVVDVAMESPGEGGGSPYNNDR